MKTITIRIDPQGQVRLETTGYTGSACREASKALERALGVAESDQPTAEAHQAATSEESARQQNRG